MAVSATFTADFSAFNTAVQSAAVKLKSFEDDSRKVETALSRMGNSFSGTKIISDATLMAKAVADAGGASTLTAREMERVNVTVNEAIAKYKALGGTAPQSMLDLADATRKIDPPITTFIGRLNQAKDGIAAFASGAKTIGMGLTASVTAPLAAVGIAAFKASTDFESAFAGVKKTVSGTPDELAKINTEFREMAKTTPTSAVGLAKIGEMAGQLGVQKDKIVGFTKTIVDISVATNLTADEAGSAFARLANVLKLPQDQFSNLGSAVVALGNYGASTEQEMLSMAQRISAAGSTAGMTAPQVLGIANALSSVGIEAEAGGTAVSKVIIQMASSVASGGKKLDEFAKVAGMSAKDFQKAWRDDAGTAFSTFMQGLANIRESGGDQLIKTIDDLGFVEVRLRNAFMSAANAGTLMADSIKLGTKAFQENTELARAAEERYKTVSNQLKVLWNQVTDVAITLGDALVPTLLDLVKAGQPVIGWLSDAAKWFKELPQWVREAAIGMAAFAAAVGPTVYVMGSLAGAVTSLIPLLTALSGGAAASGMATVIGFLGNPLVLAGAVVIGGIALAVYELHKNLSDLSHIPSVGKPLEGLKDANGHLLLTAETAKKAAMEVGGLSEQTGELADGFRLTIGTAKQSQVAIDAHTASTSKSKAELKDAAKELNDVAKAHEIVRQTSIPLTAAQRVQLQSLMDLNEAAGANVISTKTMAKEIGASETQVRVFEGSVKLAAKSLDDIIDGMSRTRQEAERLEPKLGGIGFKMAHQDITLLTGSLNLFHGGLTAAGDTLDHVIIPAFGALPGHVAAGTKALDEAAKAADSLGATIKGNLSSALASIPGTITNAFTGGGGILGALKAIATQIVNAIVEPMIAGMLKAATASMALKKSVDGVGDSASAAGAAGTSMLTVYASAALIGYHIVKSWHDTRQAIRENEAAIEDFTTALAKTATAEQLVAAGGDQAKLFILQVEEAYRKTGKSAEQAHADAIKFMTAIFRGSGGAAAALEPIAAAFDEIAKKASEDMAKALDTVFGKIDDLAGLMADVGVGIPDFLQPMIDDLLATPGLTDDVRKAIEKLRAEAGPDFAKLEQMAKGYGIEIDQLGPKFQQAHTTADAKQWISDYEKLMAAGADMNGVLAGMADEASKVVQESIKFGTEIPDNMKPMIQKLIDTGQLLDESGNKIDDISKLKFGAAVKTDVDKLADAIKALTDAINKIPKAIDDVNKAEIKPKVVKVVYDVGEGPALGASAAARLPSEARGVVLPFASRVSAAPISAVARGGSAGAVAVANFSASLERKFDQLSADLARRDVQNQQNTARAMRNEVQKVGGRRR